MLPGKIDALRLKCKAASPPSVLRDNTTAEQWACSISGEGWTSSHQCCSCHFLKELPKTLPWTQEKGHWLILCTYQANWSDLKPVNYPTELQETEEMPWLNPDGTCLGISDGKTEILRANCMGTWAFSYQVLDGKFQVLISLISYVGTAREVLKERSRKD